MSVNVSRQVRMPDAKESTTRDAGQSLDDVTLEEIVRRIVAASQPEKVVLFGSAARGEMGPHSDVNLLVVKQCDNHWDVMGDIYEELYGVEAAVDIVVVTPDDVERYKDTHALVIKPALREGRIVYQTA
ncbi:nucleotidyltransferase domain-containing protein [Candidatus Palauibacter sp.]|uniref:nucleotidyltransferase domain-containing protein n=1 Tax=Candidatus Palauibacter sp. TaxID=3101350 RepID=UPI003D11DFD0